MTIHHGYKGLVEGDKEELFNGYRVLVLDGEKVLEMDGCHSCKTM